MASKVSKRLKELDRKSAATGGSGFPPFSDASADDDLRVSWINFVLFAGIGLVLLLAAAMFFGTRSVQGGLESSATSALRAAGYQDVTVVASGHDVTLKGTFGAQQTEDEAVAIVTSLPGVGGIDTQLWLVTASDGGETFVAGDPITLSWNRQRLSVTGEVSGEEIQVFVTETAGRSFTDVDATGLSTLEGVVDETAWIGGILGLMETMTEDLAVGEIVVNPAAGVVLVSGEVETRQMRKELRDIAQESVTALGFDFTSGILLEEAPPPPPKEQVVALQKDIDEVIEGKVVEFEIKSDVITPRGTALLDEILAALGEFPDVPIEIAGHADAQGDAAANLELSERRARAVFDYLVANGANSARFVIVGYGETRPLADNNTAEGRARNRRIEFIALEE
jgi:OOP family OmpA-OmpF porin